MDKKTVVLGLCGGVVAVPACFNPGSVAADEGSTGDATSMSSVSSPSNTSEATVTASATAATMTTTEPTSTTPTSSTEPTSATGDSGETDVTTDSGDTSSGTTGCPPEMTDSGAPDVDPPLLMGAEFTEANVVTLTFTEALTNPQGVVEPAQFRLSYGWATSYPPSPPDTLAYYDLGFENGVQIAVDEVQWDSCARDQLVLHLDGDLTQQVCDRVVELGVDIGGYDSMGAILVHFAATGIPGGGPVEDPGGNALADLSPEFVLAAPALELHPAEYYVYADFPHRDPDLPIPCPF